MKELIIDIAKVEKDYLPFVGGKGANLGDMARGLKVPPGFILTSTAYRRQLEATGLQNKIKEILDSFDAMDLKALEQASREIEALFMQIEILPDIREPLIEAYHKLSGQQEGFQVAVRSSATAEDLTDASFAGQQETFLNISGVEKVIQAVCQCWASLWTSRAIHYRTRNNFNHNDVWMAVIIQEMVQSEVSGVMFTANPVTNSRNEILIEASSGLGEAIVSGAVTGDSYVVEKNDVGCNITSKTINNPTKAPLLSDYEIRNLALIGIKIERFYEDFQDVEWAFYKGEFYFLQTRPITTLGDEEYPDYDQAKLTKMQRGIIKWTEERFPNPVYPIDGMVVKVLLLGLYEAMKNHGYSVAIPDWAKIDKGIFPEYFEPPVIKESYKRKFSKIRLSTILKNDPAGGWAGEQVYLLEMLEKLQNRDISSLPLELIMEYLTEAFNHFHFFIVLRYHYFMENRVPSDILYKILKFKFGPEAGGIMENLLAGIPCITLEINDQIEELALQAIKAPAVAQVITGDDLKGAVEKLAGVQGGAQFLASFEEFLQKYGARETDMGLGGIASPTWREAPEVVFGIIRGIILKGEKAAKAEKDNLCSRVKAAEERTNGEMSKGIYGLLGFSSLIKKLVQHSRRFAIFRENSHYDITRGLHVFRILYLELGQRFLRRNILREPKDIFYLTYFEVKEIIETIYHGLEDVNTKALYKKINHRKLEQQKRLKRWKARNTVQEYKGGNLVGVPASSGLATGIARIIEDPKDFARLQPGDILVAPYTNPAWTPLFSIITGLVADSGGAASHASIIAREYGIPAVMGVGNATVSIRDGEEITIDGTKGIVYRSE